MFVSGLAQRRGSVSATVGTSNKNVISTLQNVPHGERMIGTEYLRPSKRAKCAVVGDHSSSGLVIKGRLSPGVDQSSNIEDYEHSFPVSFACMGTPEIVTPIKIPAIKGDVSILGNITAYNIQDGQGGIEEEISDFSTSIQIGDGTNFFTRDDANTFCKSIKQGSKVTHYVKYQWTSTGTVGAFVRVYGFPFATPVEGTYSIAFVGGSGIHTTEVGANVYVEIDHPPAYVGPVVAVFVENVPHTGVNGSLNSTNFDPTGFMLFEISYLV